jgi:hypothetical protein
MKESEPGSRYSPTLEGANPLHSILRKKRWLIV